MKNKKPAPIKMKPIIVGHIITFFEMFNPGDMLRTDDAVKYCKRMMGKQFYPDSGIRYMRELREKGVINYTSISKSERIIKVIAPGESHSL